MSPLKSRFTTIPPSPVSTNIRLELRAGLENPGRQEISCRLSFMLDGDTLLHAAERVLAPGEKCCIACHQDTRAMEGEHTLHLIVEFDGGREEKRLALQVIPSPDRSVCRLDGAFAGFHHWSEQEGRLWNAELKEATAEDWREMMRGMHDLGMDILVPQEMFRNQQYVGDHRIDAEGYQGRAYYPSELYPGRVDIHCPDPMEAVLGAADELAMHVFMPVGLYAWFDYSPGSLKWHKEVATELWQRYGHHPSFYGWYVSEETHGDLGATEERRQNIVNFFREFQAHCRALAPEKPVMLAPNCWDIRKSLDVYPKLLRHLDILCPFAFHRMPAGDQTGEEAANTLQKLCDEAGTHLWLDMEAFLFTEDNALYPRPVEGLIEDFRRFPNFEKIICYQYPGIFNAPWSRLKPGGPATVKLYEDYQAYLRSQCALR
jgi:hypothetical protein